ncbi:unnamed protein product, partial [Prorocentrum cordatum]
MGRLQSIRACLALLAAAYAARALTSEDHGFDELRSQYSLIQLSLGGGSVTEESAAIYESVMVAIRNNETLSHSRHIWKFVASQTYAPTLSGNGCLYLPSDQAWRSFYEWVEHPYAPMFAEMIRNAWDPDCGTSQLAACPEGHVVGNHWSLLADEAPPQSSVPNMRMPEVFAQGMGCIRTRHASTAGNIRIFEAEGHVGLPSKWMQHVNVAREDRTSSRAMRSQRLQHSRLAQDSCSDSASLPAVPEDKKLVVPTRFIICCVNLTNCAISEAMIKDQVAWMNKGYTGREDWRSKEGAPPHVNTQIEFSLNEFKFVEDDAACAKHAFSNTSLATRHNTGGVGLILNLCHHDRRPERRPGDAGRVPAGVAGVEPGADRADQRQGLPRLGRSDEVPRPHLRRGRHVHPRGRPLPRALPHVRGRLRRRGQHLGHGARGVPLVHVRGRAVLLQPRP